MVNDYKEILQDIFVGMIWPKKTIKRILNRPANLRPMFIMILILLILSILSMWFIKYKVKTMNPTMLSQIFTNNQKEVDTIVGSNIIQLGLQVFYTLVIALILSSAYLKVVVFFAKVNLTFKDCIRLVSYSYGPNIISALIMTILVFTFPVEKTMFAQSIAEIIFGSESVLTEFFNLIDIFYIWTAVNLFRYCKYFPNKKKKTTWRYFVLAIFLLPIITTVSQLITI